MNLATTIIQCYVHMVMTSNSLHMCKSDHYIVVCYFSLLQGRRKHFVVGQAVYIYHNTYIDECDTLQLGGMLFQESFEFSPFEIVYSAILGQVRP